MERKNGKNMKIAVYLNDSGFNGVNLSNPNMGNPGVGGTPYCFALLLYNYQQIYPDTEFVFIHHNKNIFPQTKYEYFIENEKDAISICAKEKVDFLLMRFYRNNSFIEKANSVNIKVVFWAHNFLYKNDLNYITEYDSIKRVICVGKEQYDQYIDHKAIKKCVCIENMFQVNDIKNNRNNKKVIYSGSLIKAKGFHVLAKMWKKILKKVPEAELYVIGSGQLYNSKTNLGKFGIADEVYESSFIKFLLDKNGNLLPSVHFCGVMGIEKNYIYQNARVGVANPTAKTETLCLVVMEMQANGLPVVAKRKNGFLDSVSKKSGLFFYTKNGMFKKIVFLLLNNKNYEALSTNGPLFIKEKFNTEKIVEKWNSVFLDITNNVQNAKFDSHFHSLSLIKIMRILNRAIKKVFPFLPSIIEIESFIHNLFNKNRKI